MKRKRNITAAQQKVLNISDKAVQPAKAKRKARAVHAQVEDVLLRRISETPSKMCSASRCTIKKSTTETSPMNFKTKFKES